MSETAYLFVDTFAFEKFALQPECRVGQQGVQMTGYESYLIEQWACERKINTVVAAYTGNSQHVVNVQILYVPADLASWSPVTRSYFEELVRMHILPKETPLGNMLVTSLSSLPSNLSLVSIPSRFRTGLKGFIANENLKRLKVAGRAAVSSATPSDSVLENFRRVYLTSQSVPGTFSVIELVTLMQIALSYFGLYPPQNVDGLLCDFTIKAIGAWWQSVGRQRFNNKIPRAQDKLYMRISCCALIGLVTGARQRLSALGLKPPKDPFDAEGFAVCVKRFQKLEKLPRTMQLDELTYFKLLQETAKHTERGPNMLTAMKSTVKEGLSGKVAEALVDWETLDLEILAKNVRGERARYIWQGKGENTVPQVESDFPRYLVGKTSGIPIFSLAAGAKNESKHLSRHHHHHHHHHHDKNQNQSQQPHINHQQYLLQQYQNQHQHYTHHNKPPSHHENDRRLSEPHVLHDQSTYVTANNTANNSAGSSNPASVNNSQTHIHNIHDEDVKMNFAKWNWPSSDPFDVDASNPTSTRASRSHSTVSEDYGSPSYINSLKRMGVYSPSEKQSRYQQPHIPEELVSKLLTKDDGNLPSKYQADMEAANIRRTASLTQIEGILFGWESLAPMAGLVNLYEESKRLQFELSQRMHTEFDVVDEMATHLHDAEEKAVEVQRENVVIKYHIQASTKKEESVKRRVRELEAFMARIDYEVANLEVKLKDVEQSVMTFASKVDTTESRWRTMKEAYKKKGRWFW